MLPTQTFAQRGWCVLRKGRNLKEKELLHVFLHLEFKEEMDMQRTSQQHTAAQPN